MKRLALALAVLLPTAALAAGPVEGLHGLSDDPEIQKLHGEIAAAKLDRSLDLTREQARALLPLLKEVQATRSQIAAERLRHRPEIIKALTGIRDDLKRTGVVSDGSRKALEDARGQNVQQLREKKRALTQKARELLTPEQRQRLQSFDPRPVDRMGKDKGDFGEEDQRRGPGRHGGKAGRKALKIAASAEFLSLLEARTR